MGRVAKACRTKSETRAPGQDSLHGREECRSTRCGNKWKQRPRMRISVARVPETCGKQGTAGTLGNNGLSAMSGVLGMAVHIVMASLTHSL